MFCVPFIYNVTMWCILVTWMLCYLFNSKCDIFLFFWKVNVTSFYHDFCVHVFLNMRCMTTYEKKMNLTVTWCIKLRECTVMFKHSNVWLINRTMSWHANALGDSTSCCCHSWKCGRDRYTMILLIYRIDTTTDERDMFHRRANKQADNDPICMRLVAWPLAFWRKDTERSREVGEIAGSYLFFPSYFNHLIVLCT